MIYLLHALLLFTTFLVRCNLLLRNAHRDAIGTLLGLVWFAELGWAVARFGWAAGAIAVAMTFVYGALTRPLAGRAAAAIHAFGRGKSARDWIGPPPRNLETLSKAMARLPDSEAMIDLASRGAADPYEAERRTALSYLLEYVDSNESTAAILHEHQLGIEEVERRIDQLQRFGGSQWRGGHFVPASTAFYPHTLEYLLSVEDSPRGWSFAVSRLFDHFDFGARLES